MHVLIAGITGSGKTTIATNLVRAYRKQNIGVIVLDPIGDERWKRAGANVVTDDKEKFIKLVTQARNCMIFVDESGEMIGHYNDEMFFLATRARHAGHVSHFLVQRPAQVSPTIRDQCTHLFLFSVSSKDAKTMADEFPKAQTEILAAPGYQKGEYIHATKFGAPVKGMLTFDRDK